MTLTILDTIKRGAAETLAAENRPDHHPVRDLARCKWYGQHRGAGRDHLAPGEIETCQDCGQPMNTRVTA